MKLLVIEVIQDFVQWRKDRWGPENFQGCVFLENLRRWFLIVFWKNLKIFSKVVGGLTPKPSHGYDPG